MPERFVLEGAWMPVTQSYLMTGSQSESIGTYRRVQSLTDMVSADTLAGMVLADGLLPRNAVGPTPRLGPEIHYGYAVQWFLLAIVLGGMSGYILKRVGTWSNDILVDMGNCFSPSDRGSCDVLRTNRGTRRPDSSR